MAGHVKRLLEGHAGEVEVVALVDPSSASIERLVGRQPAVADVPRFEDRQMLDAVRPDAVEISTPHTLHYQHIVDSFARRGPRPDREADGLRGRPRPGRDPAAGS